MRIAVVGICLVACGSKDAPPATGSGSSMARDAAPAAAIDAPFATGNGPCKTALAMATKAPAPRRAQVLLDGCQPCGPWAPLLAWSTPADQGGPTRAAIEATMTACHGFCDGTAKDKFLAALDSARGKPTRGPWRYLAEQCKAQVSAVPDARYASAPLFALDRIARDVAAKPELAPLLAQIELPLPAVSITGAGVELATSPVTAPDAGAVALTVTQTEIRIAAVPHAKLGKDGVTVVAAGEPYPGAVVTAKTFAAAVKPLATSPAFVTVFAPRELPAARIVDALAVTGGTEARLAVAAHGAPTGWTLPGTIPIALAAAGDKPATTLVLDADPDTVIKDAKAKAATLGAVTIAVTPKATVSALAKLLGALTFFDQKHVVVTRARLDAAHK
ncbi:MAG TPA: hypothetical protein VFQ53_27460 [Kofleriaceae bacterium]|nr:hypothetical protein [Kofleriaceae bacterium]